MILTTEPLRAVESSNSSSAILATLKAVGERVSSTVFVLLTVSRASTGHPKSTFSRVVPHALKTKTKATIDRREKRIVSISIQEYERVMFRFVAKYEYRSEPASESFIKSDNILSKMQRKFEQKRLEGF